MFLFLPLSEVDFIKKFGLFYLWFFRHELINNKINNKIDNKITNHVFTHCGLNSIVLKSLTMCDDLFPAKNWLYLILDFLFEIQLDLILELLTDNFSLI